MKRILVTGGAGFIGSHLCEELIARGFQVVAVDNLSLGRKENVAHLPKRAFTLLVKDLVHSRQLAKTLAKLGPFDCVFHLAANSDVARSSVNPDVDLERTFLTTFAVLRLMRQLAIKKIVFASTPAIYGDMVGKIKETRGPLFPLSHYGAGKLASEAFIASFVANYGLQAWIFRFPNVVGERATHGILYDFMRKLEKNPNFLEVLGDGGQTKPYLYVRDLIDGILFAWQHSDDDLNYYHIGVESRTKVRDIVSMTLKALRISPTISYTGGSQGWVGDQRQYAYDVSKLARLGWKSPRTSNQAVKKALESMLLEKKNA